MADNSVHRQNDAGLSSVREGDSAIVDFDETLLLVNSTNSYLRSASPSTIAYLIIKFADGITSLLTQRARNSFVYRDWLRVVLVTVFLPWVYWRWRNKFAKQVANSYGNRALLDILAERNVDVVAVQSFGFGFIINPILKNLAPHFPLLASPFARPPEMRAIGKLQWLRKYQPNIPIERCVVITDSANDRELLQAGRKAILVDFSPVPVNPLGRAYVPFFYTEKVKRPGGWYIWRGVLRQDVAATIIACAPLAARPLIAALALVFLHLSFWVIYELGYFDNDKMARIEVDGNIPPDFATFGSRMRLLPAAIASLLLAIPGCILARYSLSEASLQQAALQAWPFLLMWVLTVSFSLMVFFCYNRLAPNLRIFVYPLLQLLRLKSVLVLFPTNLVGLFLLNAFVLGRSVPYFVYRATKVRWGEFNRSLVLIMFVASIALQMAILEGNEMTTVVIGQFTVCLLWLTLRSLPELRPMLGRSITCRQYRKRMDRLASKRKLR